MILTFYINVQLKRIVFACVDYNTFLFIKIVVTEVFKLHRLSIDFCLLSTMEKC